MLAMPDYSTLDANSFSYKLASFASLKLIDLKISIC